MALSILVRPRQTLFDISVQVYGNVNKVFDLAYLNNISITDELYPGQELLLLSDTEENKEVLDLYKRRSHIPVTGDDDTDFEIQ